MTSVSNHVCIVEYIYEYIYEYILIVIVAQDGVGEEELKEKANVPK